MEPNILRASPSSPPSPKERSGIHRSWSPKSPHAPSTTLQGPPLPVVTPSPGVPVSWGLSLSGYPTSGHPSLSGVPLPGPSGTRARGHSPARLRGGARVNRRREPRPAARTEPTRTPCPAGPADVGIGAGGSAVSAPESGVSVGSCWAARSAVMVSMCLVCACGLHAGRYHL